MHLQKEDMGLPALQFRHEGCAVRMCHIFVDQKNIELHLIGEDEGFSSAPRGGSVPFTLQEMFEFNQYSFVVIHNQDFDRITDHTLTPIDSWQDPGLWGKLCQPNRPAEWLDNRYKTTDLHREKAAEQLYLPSGCFSASVITVLDTEIFDARVDVVLDAAQTF